VLRGGEDRVERRGKGRLDGVADVLEQDAMVVGDGRVENRVMPPCRPCHRDAIPLPESRGALDISKEEGDDPRGERGHDVLRAIKLVTSVLCRDVTIANAALPRSEWLVVHSS
jgi:hypothetical protein